eukprot:TRINITY_DN979_c0_g2_i7.p1 TRINITY_DN979_c0_g2~~TRINITY_DN979_c0_g2_i7.p1  ORF type:complete len:356 (-),score=78.64 TRINITY_DN979_c0_g2_i7:114-1181(-)
MGGSQTKNAQPIIYRGTAEEIDPSNYPKIEGHTLTLSDARKLGYMMYGNKEKGKDTHNILLFPGTPGSRFFCPKTIPDNVTVYVLERPGIGLSDPKPNRTILDWADDVLEFVDGLSIQHFGVIGYSSGSPYAYAVAYKLGGLTDEKGKLRLRGVSVVSSLAPPNTPNVTVGMPFFFKLGYYMAYYTPSLINMITTSGKQEVLTNPVRAGRSGMGAHAVVDQKEYQKKGVEGLFIQSSLEVNSRSQGIYVAEDYTLWCKDWGFDIADIKTKVHLYQGQLDLATTVNMATFISSQIPDSKLIVDPESGHMCIFHFWNDILNFLVSSLDGESVDVIEKENEKAEGRHQLDGADITISL